MMMAGSLLQPAWDVVVGSGALDVPMLEALVAALSFALCEYLAS